jgi:hypothetical protein
MPGDPEQENRIWYRWLKETESGQTWACAFRPIRIPRCWRQIRPHTR